MNTTIESSTSVTSLPTFLDEHDGGGTDVGGIILKIIYAILGTLGIIGNLLVCVVFIRVGTLRKTFTNIFILNQSLIDLTSAVIFVVLKFGPSLDVIPSTIGGDVLCKIWVSEYVLWGLFISSTFNLSFLAIERYLAICHPVLHRNKITMTKVKIVVVCVWFVGFIRESYWPSMNFNEDGICNVREWPNTGMQILVGFVVFATEYILPLSIMAFSYGNIILELRRRSSTKQAGQRRVVVQSAFQPNRRDNMQPTGDADTPQQQQQQPVQIAVTSTNTTKDNRDDDTMGKARKNVTKTMLIVSVTFVICWSPMSIAFFVFNLGGYLDYDSFYYYFMVVLVFCNMCVNPFIYSFKYREFRRGIQELFPCNRNRIDPFTDSGVNDKTNSTFA
ncbi:kappa-type opioid receptor-like [Glandiceps talaboti]